MLWVVVAEIDDEFSGKPGIGIPLPRAFAQICCRAGMDYRFEHDETGWRLVLTDVARPECSPEPLVSDFVKRSDALEDLMRQAVTRGLKGCAAMPRLLFERHAAQLASARAAE